MALYKYTMIFTYQSGITATNTGAERTGGWSEGYVARIYDTPTYAQFITLIQKRLGICPLGTSISRVRVQQIFPTGAASLSKVAYSAPSTWLSDVPQMALKIPFFLSTTEGQIIREFRGIPDVQVVTGEYQPTGPFLTAVTTFINELTGGPWLALRRDKSQPSFKIASIAVGGIVTMIDPFTGVARGNKIQVIRSIDPTTGRKFGYFATVSAVTDDTHFTIAGADIRVSNFGSIRIAAQIPVRYSGPQWQNVEAVTRKVGRPFRAYSGRVSKRR